MNWLRKFFKSGAELPSPSDIIQEEGIRYYENMAQITVDLWRNNIGLTLPPKVWLTTVQDTNSMLPLVDYQHTCILIAGANETEHKILIDWLTPGNVVVVQSPQLYAIHRIKKIGSDSKGRYFQTKGDNNYKADSYLSRDADVKWLLTGIIN